MTAAVRGKLADEPAAREGQIAENVESFVSGAFVRKTKAVVDRASFVEDQEIAVGDPQPQSLATKLIGFGL